MALAGCSSPGGDKKEEPKGDSSAIISTNGSEPQNPLIATNTNEVGGGKILDEIFAGLVYYDAKGAPHNDLAKSIETKDAINYTIKIRDDAKFTDGTPVKAENFVKAWNYGADSANNQLGSYFFEDIDGFSYDKSVKELPGLKVVDDTTFTVKLNKAASDFPLRLGYSAFYPLPDAGLKDMKVQGETPIGNGPYMLKGKDAWAHDEQIELVTNPDYNGPRKPKNGGLTIKFYAQQDASYTDLMGGNVDVIDQIPETQLSNFKDDLGDRAINQPAALNQTFTVPERLEHFKGEEGKLRRQALSMSFDRKQITEKIFDGTRTPASDFTSPVIDGWSDKLKGADVLEYNPEKAKQLWAEADKISPWSGTFEIAYNSDGGHQAWVDAVTNQMSKTLGIKASGKAYPKFDVVRKEVTDRTIKTAFRTGWQADYPGLYNFLGPLFATNASSNDGDYSNKDFDKLIAEGTVLTDPAAANKKYQEAQEILLQDLPAIPLWYQNVNGGYGEQVSNVEFGWNSVPLYYQITKQ
nr:ABC transporter substrate-binding protein [Leucobacter edaphi]